MMIKKGVSTSASKKDKMTPIHRKKHGQASIKKKYLQVDPDTCQHPTMKV